jgi:hypothetical protein
VTLSDRLIRQAGVVLELIEHLFAILVFVGTILYSSFRGRKTYPSVLGRFNKTTTIGSINATREGP